MIFVTYFVRISMLFKKKNRPSGGVDGMKYPYLKSVGLSLGLIIMSQTGHSAVIKDTSRPIQSLIVVSDKQSPIEKALNQQKRGESKLLSDKDQIKVLTSIKTTASQNFLAEQHQKFSRFVQAIFQPHTS